MTVARIDAKFAELKRASRAGFVTYVMAGDPDAATAAAIVKALPAAGADLIELGYPFSDPMADGPSIQRAGVRALTGGMTLAGVLDLVRDFRTGDATTPIVLMGYINPLLTYGLEAFAKDAGAAGVDGLIVVDCPPEEASSLSRALDAVGIALIRLTAPTTDDARLGVVVKGTAGFVYYVSLTGVTGVKAIDPATVGSAVERIRRASGLPVAVGFGVRTPDQAIAVAKVADAVVVGTALVDAVADAIAQNRDPVSFVVELVGSLAKAIRSARAGTA